MVINFSAKSRNNFPNFVQKIKVMLLRYIIHKAV